MKHRVCMLEWSTKLCMDMIKRVRRNLQVLSCFSTAFLNFYSNFSFQKHEEVQESCGRIWRFRASYVTPICLQECRHQKILSCVNSMVILQIFIGSAELCFLIGWKVSIKKINNIIEVMINSTWN